MPLTESEIIDRHRQSLQEAHAECKWLTAQERSKWERSAARPRGEHYVKLREALNRLEGSCRQMMYWRADARWLKLANLYARAMPMCQRWYLAQKWLAFDTLAPLFEAGMARMNYLAEMRTGVLSSTPILPEPGNMDFVRLPDWKPPWQPRNISEVN